MPTRRLRVAGEGTRDVDLNSMVRHGRTGSVEVDAVTATVALGGEVLAITLADRVALSRPHYLRRPHDL